MSFESVKAVNSTGLEDLTDIHEHLRIFLMYISPTILLIGIFGNFSILAIMGSKSIYLSKTTRIYYFTIGLADFLDIIIGWGFKSFTDDILYMYTNGNLYFPLFRLNGLTCKVSFACWAMVESLSDYTVVAMGIERVIAVWYASARKFYNAIILKCSIQ